MGQNVNYLLGNQSTMLGADPELYRQQLIQQEQQRIGALPANQQLGAQLGNLLGRGVTNVAQGRGFFEVTNPVLQKLTQIQDIYSTSMQQADPNDPASFYKTLQQNFANAGLGQQAMMAQQEFKKFEGIDIKNKKDLTELYTANPGELTSAIARATDQGNEAEVTKLTKLQDTIEKKRGLDLALTQARINLDNAQAGAAQAQARKALQDVESGKFEFKIYASNGVIPSHMAKINKKTGETTYEPLPKEAMTPNPNASADGKAPAGERPALSTFGGTPPGTPAPVAAPTAAPASQAELPALDPQTKIYYASRDPVLKSIQAAVQADPNRLATDPEWFKQLTNARNQQLDYLRKQYGNMVSFQGL